MAIPTKLKCLVYLAGTASFHHAVMTFSDEQLCRVMKYEEIESENADVARRVMALMLRSQVAWKSGVSRVRVQFCWLVEHGWLMRVFSSLDIAIGIKSSNECVPYGAAAVVPVDVRQ